MRKMFFAFAAVVATFVSFAEAGISRAIVRQQWPWSRTIKVEYALSGVTVPVDISVSAFIGNGGTAVPVPANAISGKRFGIEQSQVGELSIDPVAAFGANLKIDNLKIELSVSPSADNLDEALYKIFDLSDGSCTNVTRKALLNGEWGDYETDYSKIGEGFTTSEPDVLIWTGVTNNPAYKTTHLVMRKVHATGKTWQSGDAAGTLYGRFGLVSRYWVKLTYDYYIGVFETTLAQYKAIYGSYPANYKLGPNDEDTVPANNTYYYNVVGYTMSDYADFNTVVNNEKLCFPTNSYVRDVGKKELCAKMWSKMKCEFTLPTQAEWEFACRAGTDGALYSGEAQTVDNVTKLAWHVGISGNTPQVVGGKCPNAFGLYDMLGNAVERVLSSGEMNQGATSGSGESQADPAIDPLGNPNTLRNTAMYSLGGGFMSSTSYSNGLWQDCRASSRTDWYGYGNTNPALGFRLVMPATANGQWAEH